MGTTRIYIIAGEPSGDALGAKLIQSLRNEDTHITFKAIGGDQINAQGVSSLFPMKDIAVMGFTEVIPHIRTILKRIEHTVDDIINFKPDIVITIDAPGFCKRVVKRLKRKNYYSCHYIHYVAPTVWAYKPKRAERFAEIFDHIMVLLPFEVPYFKKAGLNATFVGHSILEESVTEGDANRFRTTHHIDKDKVILSVLCGSRTGEVKRLYSIFRNTIKRLIKQIPNLFIVFPTIEDMKPLMHEMTHDLEVPHVVITDRASKFDAYAASHCALCKSGTISLELSLANVPMVIAYKVSFLSAWLLKRMIKVDYVNLINILAQDEVIPECLQERCEPNILSDHLLELCSNDRLRQFQRSETQRMLELLKPDTDHRPSQVAAQTVLKILHTARN